MRRAAEDRGQAADLGTVRRIRLSSSLLVARRTRLAAAEADLLPTGGRPLSGGVTVTGPPPQAWAGAE